MKTLRTKINPRCNMRQDREDCNKHQDTRFGKSSLLLATHVRNRLASAIRKIEHRLIFQDLSRQLRNLSHTIVQ